MNIDRQRLLNLLLLLRVFLSWELEHVDEENRKDKMLISFLVLSPYYRRFIIRLAKIIKKFHEKISEAVAYKWNEDKAEEFELLKVVWRKL